MSLNQPLYSTALMLPNCLQILVGGWTGGSANNIFKQVQQYPGVKLRVIAHLESIMIYIMTGSPYEIPLTACLGTTPFETKYGFKD